ncbi:pH sensor molecule [Komagataella phaffii CBS 7435]|uniref:pH-response regulator protein palH/RIM21 n=2 Tax=Komagataella phaffii TaxID=460519 RepID=C4QZK0_KOMPG|nr:Component of the RIM101 pathway, has a role in cell wall construction and alkaline pH response [Komagataella phaffii GS115]AOA62918.1 GQ67_00096T0 [Komagataella phaffii]CAH2448831.1 pH sensor molecule [Komagataella phaffii CBS 7435]AOA68078.1 GQ68_01291T0 [Komagataella phaffii GS115]CAY68674.1 Component of the RIM101 pathway, has a role in cell wall construction and alkaline pH response [Komagataella phaffii GS115]CCA38912.1 pH sensor molecule [Komagataella phaffii CBS 7435]
MTISKRNIIWRYRVPSEHTYPTCEGVQLGEGIIMCTDPAIMAYSSSIKYHARCYDGHPVYSAMNNRLQDEFGISTLPIIDEDWQLFASQSTPTTSPLESSIYPLIYTLSASAVIIGYLTIIVFTKNYLHSQRPTKLLRLSILLGAVAIMMYFVASIVELNRQHRYEGVSNADLLISYLNSRIYINVVLFFAFFALLLAQVQIITRLFPRRKEKRYIFIVGTICTVLIQIIWALSAFLSSNYYYDSEDESKLAMIPAFMYLLRISLAVVFSSLVCVYAFSKSQYLFDREMFLLTAFTAIAINITVAFFIADVSEIWVSELSEVFNVTSYVICNVTTWEWINRISYLEKMVQRASVLGRPYYEDDVLESTNRRSISGTGDHVEFSKKLDISIDNSPSLSSSVVGSHIEKPKKARFVKLSSFKHNIRNKFSTTRDHIRSTGLRKKKGSSTVASSNNPQSNEVFVHQVQRVEVTEPSELDSDEEYDDTFTTETVITDNNHNNT